MEIRFVSSLTEEDENRLAGSLVAAVQLLLEPLPIAYVLRIETGSAKIFQHSQFSPHADPKPVSAREDVSTRLPF